MLREVGLASLLATTATATATAFSQEAQGADACLRPAGGGAFNRGQDPFLPKRNRLSPPQKKKVSRTQDLNMFS